MLDDIRRNNEKLSNKIDKTKKQLNEELIEKMTSSFKVKEDEMAQDIKAYWELKYREFLNTSEYYSPHDFQLLQLKVSHFNKEFYKSCWYTLQQLGIKKHDGKRTHGYYGEPNKELIEAHNRKQLDRFIDMTVTESILNSRYKLLQSTLKHFDGVEINEVQTVDIALSKGNLVGTFKIKKPFGLERTLVTQAIYAGGYNIQKFHIRYLSKVS